MTRTTYGGKPTMKSRVMQFVKSKGFATFTEIQRFVYDQKYGDGKYDKGTRLSKIQGYGPGNIHRGHYCCAFSGKRPYLLLGSPRLEKQLNGSYIVQE